jgi:hypothetical protein
MCNTVRNPVTSSFVTRLVTLPQRNAAPDPTRPNYNYRAQDLSVQASLS